MKCINDGSLELVVIIVALYSVCTLWDGIYTLYSYGILDLCGNGGITKPVDMLGYLYSL